MKKIETGTTILKNQWTQELFFENIKETDRYLARLTQKKKKEGVSEFKSEMKDKTLQLIS